MMAGGFGCEISELEWGIVAVLVTVRAGRRIDRYSQGVESLACGVRLFPLRGGRPGAPRSQRGESGAGQRVRRSALGVFLWELATSECRGTRMLLGSPAVRELS
jgi:hypothetical protein